jgi:putative NIF3 family GTP cyclohydrolase 1 type 2
MQAHTAAPTATILAEWVREQVGDHAPRASNGVWRPGDGRAIRRLGVALEGNEETARQAQAREVDALLLHRPWWLGPLPEAIAVLAFHEALDDRLTTGSNPWLAEALGFRLGETISEQHGRPLVCLAHALEPVTVATLLARLVEQLPDAALGMWNPKLVSDPVHTIALANAMRPVLVAMAAHKGATVYVTGTLRPSAESTLLQTSMMAVGLGHEPIERWGLHWLCKALRAQFPLEVIPLD